MLRDDFARVRKSATNIAARMVAEKVDPLLDKIAKLEARVAKLERAPESKKEEVKNAKL